MLSGALDALDHLHATLASWAHLVLEGYPDGEHMAGPDERGTRRTLSTVVEFDGHPMIRRSTIAGVRDPEATSRLARWLLPWCSAQDWAGEMRNEIAATVRTTPARYPVEERTRRVPGVACPGCDRPTLLYDPATAERPTVQVSCTNRLCGRIYTEAVRPARADHRVGARRGREGRGVNVLQQVLDRIVEMGVPLDSRIAVVVEARRREIEVETAQAQLMCLAAPHRHAEVMAEVERRRTLFDDARTRSPRTPSPDPTLAAYESVAADLVAGRLS